MAKRQVDQGVVTILREDILLVGTDSIIPISISRMYRIGDGIRPTYSMNFGIIRIPPMDPMLADN